MVLFNCILLKLVNSWMSVITIKLKNNLLFVILPKGVLL